MKPTEQNQVRLVWINKLDEPQMMFNIDCVAMSLDVVTLLCSSSFHYFWLLSSNAQVTLYYKQTFLFGYHHSRSLVNN